MGFSRSNRHLAGINHHWKTALKWGPARNIAADDEPPAHFIVVGFERMHALIGNGNLTCIFKGGLRQQFDLLAPQKLLFDLEESNHNLIWIALTGTDKQTLRQPLKCGRGGFEFRLRAEVHELRIHCLSRE